MLLELGNGKSVPISEIDSIDTVSPESDADFAYHPVTKVKTKAGTVLETTKTESELRNFIASVSPTSPVLEHPTQEAVEINPEEEVERDTDVRERERDDLGDLIQAQKKIGEELEAIRAFLQRFVHLAEDGKIGVTVNNQYNNL